MSVPFPDHDFLCGNWRSLDDIARKTDGEFPIKLPLLNALDFDKVKDSVCAYRGWGLCSVDVVTIAEDGRIFLIEFKDTRKNPIAWLKKKGFDSLFLFWIVIGQSLSMNEIRDRAVFCYVITPETRYDDEIYSSLETLAGHRPTVPKPDQLEELKNTGLYGDVRLLEPSEFCSLIQKVGVVQTIDELKNRISTAYHLPRPRQSVPQARVDSTTNFKSSVYPIAELRMAYPFDQKIERPKSYEVLRVADAYDAGEEKATWEHDWQQPYPIMALMACCFDTFMLWCLAYHPEDRLNQLGLKLKGLIAFKGKPLTSLNEPPSDVHHEYRHRFWEIYSRQYTVQSNYGLSVLKQKGVYGELNYYHGEDEAVE